ncbi:PREDICTED: uncharacterized protein K02A2.6-like [Acropora digitifera]|uniref:uncharacterized protein K02A2.6-like n=1 Tax=Acropora digitifera TaxID=70779 RepID=UPI00077A3A6B|nr:PREDICTED: uncharacterized protein K02A2.6-like [Acropora digitifera]
MYIADALSTLQPQHAEMTAHVASVITGLPASDTRLQRIIEAQDEDPVCRQIKTYCSEGWPDKHSVKDAMKPYWSTRGELTVVQNILLKGTRIVIPSSMRLEILDKIHEGHQGIAKCRERAKSSVWWPGLSREIQDLVQQCRTCALHRDNKPEPLIATPLPDRPWQIVATDLFQMRGMDYLIVIDYYSRYVEVAAMTKTTKSSEVIAMTKTTKSSEVIRALRSIFARHGIPEQVRSDNGPQYDSAEFSHFAKQWGFKHVTSSPRFPQSNGEVERGVRTVKNLLLKAEDPAKGLLAYRSTPLACKFSPAQLLMGRKLRNSVPMFHTELNPHWPDLEKLHARESESKLKQQSNFNLRHKATPLTPLEPGTEVHVKDLDRPGVVVKAAETPRSYEVKTPTSTVRRNRVHLAPMPQQRENQPVPAEDKIAEPVQADQHKLKLSSQAAPATPLLVNRPKRLLKPSLKVRENLGLI